MKHIHKLTGLRGLAAFIVFISHSANEGVLPKILGNGFGQIGVMLFFVLSGFLMTHLYVHEVFNMGNVKKYMFARIGRVFPLYFTLLLLSVVITRTSGDDYFYPFRFYDLKSIIEAIFLIKANYVFWTIPVEVQFYILFIGFWFLFKKGCNAYILSTFTLATMIPSAAFYILISPDLPKIISTYSFAFFLGVSSALLYERIKHNATIQSTVNFIGLPALILLFINLPELRSQYGLQFTESFFLKTWGDPMTWIITYVVFISAVLNASSLSILESYFFVYLGKISYGFYLIHYPVLMFFVKIIDANLLIKFSSALLVTLTLSHISFFYFEKRLGEKIRNYGKPKVEQTKA